MKIEKRLRLNTIFSLGVAISIIFALGWSFWEIQSTDQQTILADKMRDAAFKRIILRDEFLLYREYRAKAQWYAKTEDLRGLFALANAVFTAKNQRAILKDAKVDFDATVSGFSAVMERRTSQPPGAKAKRGYGEAELQLINQVFLKAYFLSDNINSLHESAHKAETKAKNRGYLILSVCVFIGIAAIIANSTQIMSTLQKRITILSNGVEYIGSGNLDYRIAIEGDDELSALAQAGNEMAAKLKTAFISNADLEQHVAKRTAQLEAANKELEAFAYSVSHDLRAPLRAVDGYTRILVEDYESVLDAEGKRVCSVISESARDMGKLIDDLLAFSRVGRTSMHPSAIDMATMARALFFEITTPEARERIDFIVNALPFSAGDPALYRQVWTNLLSNAVKFSSKKDRARIEVGAEQRDGEILYSVRDNGAGFDMRYVNKLFGVFQRLHGTKEFEGTGVGLAIVQRIIARHGGRVWGEGEVGKGATFYFAVKREASLVKREA